MSQQKPRIRWFTPDKPANISIGRQRISSHLRAIGYDVKTVATTVETIKVAVDERDQYDIIIGTTRAGAFAGTLIGQLTGKSVIIDHIDPIRQFRETHSAVTSIPVRIAENVCFALADCVMFVYGEEQNRVERYAKNVRQTNLGVDYDRFADPDSEVINSVHERLSSLPLKNNIVIYVGGLEPIYNIRELILSMENLPEWSLIVLGDGKLRETVKQASSERQNIHYLGTVPHKDIPGYVALADVGISLVDDPHTLKILEYGAAGLSVVQAVGKSEERFGEMVEFTPIEPEEIAEAIESAERNEPNSTLASLAAKFDWENVAADYEEALKSVK